jgi:hypothetical protein
MGIVMASSKYPSTRRAGYYTPPSDSHKTILECGLGNGTNNYQEVKVLVDFDEISLRRTEGYRYLWRLFTGSGMAKGNQKAKNYGI